MSVIELAIFKLNGRVEIADDLLSIPIGPEEYYKKGWF